MINDLRLLASLHDIKDTEAHDYLKKLQKDVLVASKSAPSDRLMNQSIGALRFIDDLLEEIETAHDRIAELREQEQVRLDMGKAF